MANGERMRSRPSSSKNPRPTRRRTGSASGGCLHRGRRCLLSGGVGSRLRDENDFGAVMELSVRKLGGEEGPSRPVRWHAYCVPCASTRPIRNPSSTVPRWPHHQRNVAGALGQEDDSPAHALAIGSMDVTWMGLRHRRCGCMRDGCFGHARRSLLGSQLGKAVLHPLAMKGITLTRGHRSMPVSGIAPSVNVLVVAVLPLAMPTISLVPACIAFRSAFCSAILMAWRTSAGDGPRHAVPRIRIRKRAFMESRTLENEVTEVPRCTMEAETPRLIIQVDEVPVASERCATVGKNGNNRAESTISSL